MLRGRLVSCWAILDVVLLGLRKTKFRKGASPENPMKACLYKTTTDGLKDLPRKVAMVRAKGALDFAKGVS